MSQLPRVTWTDDDGSDTTGTIINNAQLQAIYDSIDDDWAWTSVSHADSNFTGDGTDANWVVASGDQNTFKYFRVGKKLTVALTIATSSVANTPAQLRATIPGGSPSTGAAGGAFFFSDNGTSGIGRWSVDAAGTVINFSKVSGNWTNSTNLTIVQADCTFEVD